MEDECERAEVMRQSAPIGLGMPRCCEMLRDVLVLSIERGQFTRVMLSFIAILIVVKLPADVMSALIVRLLDSFDRGCIWGYLAAGVLAASWYFHWRRHSSTPQNLN